MSNSRQLIALGLFLILFASVSTFAYFKTSQKISNPRTIGISHVKQLATSTVIYQSDNDGLYPATSSMPGTRSVLIPYVKSKELFEGYVGSHTRPLYNFNVAGVHESLPPYPGTTQQELQSVGVFFARSIKKPGYFYLSRGDSSVKATKAIDLQFALSHQFDRRGVVLMPADYLADQDPLKEMK